VGTASSDRQCDWQRTPGYGKYAQVEIERRFLLAGEPPEPLSSRTIEDRYLDGLRLRLRAVFDGAGHGCRDGGGAGVGAGSVFKLTQKVRRDDDDPARIGLTTMYLSAAEHERLQALPAAVLIKTRHTHRHGPHTLVVDEFHDRPAGLRLAEVELDNLDQRLDLPAWIGAEVTADERFTGGSLARADSSAIAEILAHAR
jgi:CYTH domain-containing protein